VTTTALAVALVIMMSGAWLLPKVQAAENMSFHGTLYEDVPCEFDDAPVLNIDFGVVGVNKIDGVQFKKNIDVVMTCQSGFSARFKAFYLGQKSSFDATALATSVDGLAIKAMYLCSNSWCDLDVGDAALLNRSGFERTAYLAFTLIKQDGIELKAGDFQANASLQLEYY